MTTDSGAPEPTEFDSHGLPSRIEPRVVYVRDVDSPPPPTRFELSDRWQRRQRRAWILFILTCLSTWWVGTGTFPAVERPDGTQLTDAEIVRLTPAQVTQQKLTFAPGYWNGLRYALAVMGILLAHEMGHYLQARRYRVPATLPFFIPMPISPFGTMGAVILQGSGTADRRSMFDIAITGPLAGLVIAIPVLIWGIESSTYTIAEGGISYGDPLLVKMLGAAIHGQPQPREELILTPLLFAGWVGVFITSLNLIPVGQLDGGHILYCLIGRRAHTVAVLIVAFAVGYCIFVDASYVVIIVLLFLMGLKHPPTRDDTVPIGRTRVVLGWLTLAFIIIGFTPRPITIPTGGDGSDEAVEQPADYGDAETVRHVGSHGKVLDLRMAIRDGDNDRTGSLSRSTASLAVLQHQHG